jgi:hypothetical protein
MKRLLLYIIILPAVIVFFGCKKASFIMDKDAALIITADTLSFDTVFTSVGSVTQNFTIVNPNDRKLRLQTVRLMGGSNSPYKINIDGIASTEVHDVEINAGDSVYVFVSVTVDPSSSHIPFIVSDSILIGYNGNERYVQLEAYGQNAHFLKNYVIDADATWENDLPYVVSGGLLIKENTTLTIEKGCRIYMHANAPVTVDGSLVVNGTKADSVTFGGDRLDDPYRDLPASWPGIYFSEKSRDNVLTHAIVKNAYQGIICAAPAPGNAPKLQMNACMIDNIYDAGIVALGTSISAVNCLISNCGSNISITAGGTYDFTFCTIASFGNSYIEHKQPVTYINNFDDAGNNYSLSAIFKNCIIWGDGGSVENEVVAEKKGDSNMEVLLDHSLYKAESIAGPVTLNNSIANQDPAFDSINTTRHYFDFHLGKNASPAVDAGVVTTVTADRDGNPRDDKPDLGCYEKQ